MTSGAFWILAADVAGFCRACPSGGSAQYFGIDLHETALHWLRKTMPEGIFSAGSAMPPVDIEAQHFDLIYSVSVLTHLTQEQERAWLDEWHRLLKVGGYLIATFRGEDWVEGFTIERQKKAIRKAWSERRRLLLPEAPLLGRYLSRVLCRHVSDHRLRPIELGKAI